MNETSDYNNFNGGSETFPQGCDPKGHGPSNNNLRQLRLQSDQALINCVLEDTNHTTYFTSPPIHQLSLFFKNPRRKNLVDDYHSECDVKCKIESWYRALLFECNM